MFDIITIGGATRDITFLTDQGKVVETPEDPTARKLLAFEYGAKIRSEEVEMSLGGGACNAAATFARMGLKTAVLSRVGNDGDGKSILENLGKRGIGTELMQIDDRRSSAFSFIVVDSGHIGGERVIFSHKGAANFLEIEAESLGDAPWIYLTSLGDNFADSLGRIKEAVAAHDLRLAWNPGATEIAQGRSGLAEYLPFTTILIVNRDEATELVKSDPASVAGDEDCRDVVRLAAVLKSWGAQNVVITDGSRGACLATEEGIFKSPAFVVAQVDTTGAGDAFGSALVAGYILTGSFETALKYAVLNGGGEVSEFGAESGIMTRAEIEEKLEKIEIEKIR